MSTKCSFKAVLMMLAKSTWRGQCKESWRMAHLVTMVLTHMTACVHCILTAVCLLCVPLTLTASSRELRILTLSPPPSTAREECIMNTCSPKTLSFVHSVLTEQWLIKVLLVNWSHKGIPCPRHHPSSSPTKVIFLSFWSHFLLTGSSGFPGGSVVKNPPAKAGDMGLILGSGRSLGEGNGNPPQYSCLGNPTDKGAWRLQSMGLQKSQIWLSD